MSNKDLGSSGTYLVLGAVVAFGLLAVGRSSLAGPAAPGSVVLEPVYAAPAERVEELALGSGQTLGRILWNEAGLDANEQEVLLDAFRSEADPRRLSPGTRIALRRDVDGWLRGMEVSLSPDETLQLTRSEPDVWEAATVVTPVVTDTLRVAGSIESILWTSVLDNPDLQDVPALDRVAMIHGLDQVFQWQVDFSRQIREGDAYRFVFERQVRPDGTMRSGHVVAAELTNQGTSYQAFWFDPNGDGQGTYYDREGRSVRRAFLRKPLEFRYISSRFSPGRFHPILKRWRAHQGVDYAADRGTPVMATGNGVVTHAGVSGGYGNLVEIRHPNGFTTRYGHLRGFADGIRSGARVRQGQVVAYVGATGLATGPHLHYELRRNGEARDPLAIDLPPGDPVPDEQRDTWTAQVRQASALLDRLPDAGTVRMARARSEDASEAAPSTGAPAPESPSTGAPGAD